MDKDKDETKEGGISLTPTSLNCLPCRCRKNLYHKETTSTRENNKQTIIIVEDRSSFKIGRGVTPENNIFKPDQTGSIAICDTGWGKGRTPTPEECEERIDKLETDMKDVNQDVKTFKNNLNIMD